MLSCHHGLLSNQQALNAFFGLRNSNSEWVWVNGWVPQPPLWLIIIFHHCPSWVWKWGKKPEKTTAIWAGKKHMAVNPWILESWIFSDISWQSSWHIPPWKWPWIGSPWSRLDTRMVWVSWTAAWDQGSVSFVERFFKRKTTRTLDTQLELNGDESKPTLLNLDFEGWTSTYQLFWCSPKAPLFWPTANIPQIWGKNWTLVLELFSLNQNRDHKMMFSWVKLEWHPLTPANFRTKNHFQYGCPSRLP